MPDPSYPCNRHFVSAADGHAVLVPTTAAERYQLSAAKVQEHWGAAHARRAAGLAVQSRPAPRSTRTNCAASTTSCSGQRRHHAARRDLPGPELRRHLRPHRRWRIDDQVISINSFSKYFNMTGWRLGWMVVPEALVPVIERLAQNLFICPSTVAQHAALACFEPESIAEYERRRAEFKARRDWFIPQLRRAWACTVPVVPDGAFYAWADCSDGVRRRWASQGSWDFAFEVMRRAHVAVTPGRDFGHAETSRFVRFSTANSHGAAAGSGGAAARPAGMTPGIGLHLAGARLLGRHRCRRHRLLRQLPEVLRARAHRVAALAGHRASARCAKRPAACSSSARPRCATCAPARLDDELLVTAAARSSGPASLIIAQQARLQATARLLCEGTIRIGWVDAATLRPATNPARHPGSARTRGMNQDLSILQLVLGASWVVQLVMLLLLVRVHRQLGGHLPQAVRAASG